MKFIQTLFLYFIVFILLFWALPGSISTVQAQKQESQVYEAVVQNTTGTKLHLLVTSGNLKGKTYTTDVSFIPKTQREYAKGDKVIITYSKTPEGNEAVYITDVPRQMPLFILFVLFAGLTLFISRWQGLTSLIAMAFSFVVIGKFIVPNILLGNDPMLITLFGAMLILPTTYYLSHGFNKKTTVALVATLIALVATGLLSYLFVEAAHLSGFNTEEAAFLNSLGTNINIKSILLSGIIIGILAVLDDITISQASIVHTLHKTKPSASVKELFASAMTVGRDHIASLVNTLILVYAGASLPLFVLFYNSNSPWYLIINQEIIAAEIIRSLVSSIGIIAAVPLTTYLAAVAYKKNLL